MQKKFAVIYHANCPDGFGAAWAAYKKLGNKAEYLARDHGQPIPDSLDGRDVYVVDFSYPESQMRSIMAASERLTVIDHHVSAKAVVESVPNHVYDNDHSGAVLSWGFFHPGKKVPKLLQYVEDVDLWKFKLKNTKEVMASLGVYPLDFKAWDKLAKEFESAKSLNKHVADGKVIGQYKERIIEKTVGRAVMVELDGHSCLAVNSTVLASEIGNRLVQKMPPIAIVYSENSGKKIVSLRSNGKVDVSQIAAKYGGGGHKAAAGFQLKLNELYPWEIK